MNTKKILVFVNFTEASMQAVKQALALAKINGSQLHLCYVSPKGQDASTDEQLREYSKLAKKEGITATINTGKGDFFEEGPNLVKTVSPDLVIAGTIGAEGFSLSHLGSAAYRLARSLPCPTLILQSHSSIASNGYRNVMLPLSAHSNFLMVVKTLPALMAPDGLVTLLGVVQNNGELNEKLTANAVEAQRELDRMNVKWTLSKPSVPKISLGYGKIILDEMKKEGMDLIAMPTDIARSSRHYGKMDKEAILSNDYGFPVLCLNTDIDEPEITSSLYRQE